MVRLKLCKAEKLLKKILILFEYMTAKDFKYRIKGFKD